MTHSCFLTGCSKGLINIKVGHCKKPIAFQQRQQIAAYSEFETKEKLQIWCWISLEVYGTTRVEMNSQLRRAESLRHFVVLTSDNVLRLYCLDNLETSEQSFSLQLVSERGLGILDYDLEQIKAFAFAKGDGWEKYTVSRQFLRSSNMDKTVKLISVQSWLLHPICMCGKQNIQSMNRVKGYRSDFLFPTCPYQQIYILIGSSRRCCNKQW